MKRCLLANPLTFCLKVFIFIVMKGLNRQIHLSKKIKEQRKIWQKTNQTVDFSDLFCGLLLDAFLMSLIPLSLKLVAYMSRLLLSAGLLAQVLP